MKLLDIHVINQTKQISLDLSNKLTDVIFVEFLIHMHSIECQNDNPQRYLVREKPVKVTNHKMKDIENRYLFLFNDIFLIAKRRGSRRLMSSNAPFVCVRWFYFKTVTSLEPLIDEGTRLKSCLLHFSLCDSGIVRQ